MQSTPEPARAPVIVAVIRTPASGELLSITGARRPALLPTAVDVRVRTVALASLAAEILLVATGGAVRLSDSGLGCPTWPRCTVASLTTTPAMGVHGLIEFGNRLLTVVLVAVAVLAVLAVLRMRRSRPDLFALALAQIVSIPAQAVLGGVSVLTHLNPWVVGAHFVFSLVLVVLMTLFVLRTRGDHRLRSPASAAWRLAGAAVAASTAVVVLLGVTTTGSGPHAGDATAPRNGLDALLLQQVHEVAAFALVAITVVMLVAAVRIRRPHTALLVLTGVEALQIVVGMTQVALGWAAGLVIVHVLLAACLTSAAAAVVIGARSDGVRPDAAARHPDGGVVRTAVSG